MREAILEILKRWAEADVNLHSEGAREAIAQAILESILEESPVAADALGIASFPGQSPDNDIYG